VRKTIIVWGLALFGAFLLMQLIPYRISNPSLRNEPTWDSPRTRALAVRACYDCHSNEVKTPWYGKIAPVSWWLTNHVDEGRAALNFSDWKGPAGEGARNAAETVRDGSMPPSYFTWLGLHSKAKLTPAEKQELANGLSASLSH
jgi:hypothetical protein